jgi:hypothetical protein
MRQPDRIFFITAGVAAIGIAYFYGRHGQQADMQAMSRKLDALQAQQTSLADAYLTGNPDKRDALAKHLSYRPVPRQADDDPIGSPKAGESADRQLRDSLDLKTEFEQKFASEPVNPRWAGKTRNAVQDAIVNIAATEGTVPKMAEVDCRSSTCRIHLNLRDREEVGMLTESLFVDIASILPSAKTVLLPTADGNRVDVYIFSTQRPTR